LEVDIQQGKKKNRALYSFLFMHKKNREGIQSYVMAAANSWGLFLVIVFMGYGLVSVPRSLWYSGSYDRHLHQHYANAAKLKEECMDSEIEFNELAKVSNNTQN
jgi:hypothetical protein